MAKDTTPRTPDPEMTLAESLSLFFIPVSIVAPSVAGAIISHGELAASTLGVISSILIFVLAAGIKRHFSFKLQSERPTAG